MGVRGLTSYIAQNAELYLKPYELHDCDLVIDGDNLSCNLYKDVSGCNSAFGGDYDEYYRTVIAFFHLLFECNIRPFVLLDGGYERKKMRTVEQRLRGKIALIKHLDPSKSKPLFPLMMREVFVDACNDCDVEIMRCLFEADDELAVLSRKLNCPLLSYDSDFYIHNVKYIPLVTLTMKVLTKTEDNSENRNHLRQCEAKNLKKRKKINRGVKLQQESTRFAVNSKKCKSIKYLDCCIYQIEHLTYGCRIQRDMLPIFAALLGNDYIEASVFKQFYSNVCLKGTNKKISKKQRRIVATLRWLKHETKESALNKVLTRLKKSERESLLLQIQSATCGYNEEKSDAYNYFKLCEVKDDLIETLDDVENTKDNDKETENEEMEEDEEIMDDERMEEDEEVINVDTVEEDEEVTDDETVEEGDEIEKEIEKDDKTEGDEEENEEEVEEEENEEEVEEEKEEEINNEYINESETKNGVNVNTFSNNCINTHDNENNSNSAMEQRFPSWFQRRVYSAQLPRFCIDLLHQNLYINNPQIENFLFSDCNEIALPILQQVFSLLHYPEKRELRYLTRISRLTNVQYKKLNPIECTSEFVPNIPNLNVLKDVFRSLKLPTDELFDAVKTLPKHIRLYILAIIYWSFATQHSDKIHFYAILICLVVLNTVDSKIVPIRDEKSFYKRYHKTIQKERILRILTQETDKKSSEKNNARGQKAEKVRELLKNLKPYEKINFISKAECLLVQENLLKFFKLPEFVRTHHTEFSSSTMHGFSEFQAVVFQLNTLNVVANWPFESVKMGQMYSGMFLYNLYTTLSCRVDVNYYIQNHILRDSPIMFEFYQFLLDWCKRFVAFLSDPPMKKHNKKSKRKSQKLLEVKSENCKITRSSSESDFNDFNNKFCTLLQLNC